MNELALFAGAGGGILGSKLLGHRIVCAVEIEPYCREVLLRRQEEGILEPFPIWDDVRTFEGKPWRGVVDCVSAGFPCQPFSVAGKRRGADDERNMWPDTIRIIGEVRPRYALLENVPGLLVSGYMGRIFGDISELGYDCRWGVIGADDVGAPHRRKRLWIFLSDSDMPRAQRRRQSGSMGQEYAWVRKCGPETTWWDTDPADLPDTGGDTAGSGDEERSDWQFSSEHDNRDSVRNNARTESGWTTITRLGRVAHGMAYRVDRLKAIGNGQVPRVAQETWERLAE